MRWGERVRSAALLAPYGRHNEIDNVLQQAWDSLAEQGADSVRVVLGLLTAIPRRMFSGDAFCSEFYRVTTGVGDRPEADPRRRSSPLVAP